MEPSDILRQLDLSQIGGKSASVTVNITTSSTPYSVGDAIGSVITLPDVMFRKNGTSLLKSVVVLDSNGQSSALTILFFNTNPTAATVTDNLPFAFNGTLFNVIGKINISSNSYDTIDAKSIVDVDTFSTVF